MKSFIQNFKDARRVSTPFIAVRTSDPQSTITNSIKSLGDKAAETPIVTWDSIHGLKGWSTDGTVDSLGSRSLMAMVALAQSNGLDVTLGASVDLPIALAILEFASEENLIVFAHNPHLMWATDVKVIQGIWNLRQLNTANGNMLVLM